MGGTALGFAITFGPNKLEAVKALVKAGANPLAFTGLAGTTCLHSAAGNKDTDAELVRYLLELPGVRALINKPGRARTLKWKAILLAARLFVKMRTQNAVMVEISEWSKNTALIGAARNGNAAVMKVLVEEGGADTQLPNSRGHTALELLVGGANALEELRMLLGGGGQIYPKIRHLAEVQDNSDNFRHFPAGIFTGFQATGKCLHHPENVCSKKQPRGNV